MNKKFTNAYGEKIEFTDTGVDFISRDVYASYDEIESIRLKKRGKVFWVYRELGKCDFFIIDPKDQKEFKTIVDELKGLVVDEREENDIKSELRKFTRACIGITLFSLMIVGIMILCGYFKLIVLSLILLLMTAFMVTWVVNSCQMIVPHSLLALKIRNIIFQIIIIIICLGMSFGSFFYFKPGFRKGEYLDKTCYWYDCDRKADGGMYYGGIREPDKYYCEQHFEVEKKYAESKQDNGKIDETDVWFEAKDIVKSRLKAPSTASFCSQSSATITKSGRTWTITGYVDAENSFGAMIRNNFTVQITFNKNSTQYSIDKCVITAQ